MTVPCKDCPDRVQGCHGNCEKYKEFRARCEELRANNFRRRDVNSYIINGYVQRRERAVKKRRK